MNPIHQPSRNCGKYLAAVAGLFTTPDPDQDGLFFYHLPTHTFAELQFGAGPGGSHVLKTGASDQIPEAAFLAIAAHMHRLQPGSQDFLAAISRPEFLSAFPEHTVMVSVAGETAALIHYPAIGFTAGIRGDGSKIPPHWRDAAILTPEQRTHFLAQASDTLMQALARHAAARQAT